MQRATIGCIVRASLVSIACPGFGNEQRPSYIP